MTDVRSFSEDARREIGYQLYKVQVGLEPSDWKALPNLGSGAQEIRVRLGNEFRVIYVAKFAEAIYVVHAFVKKTGRTARRDLELAGERLQVLMQQRRQL